MKKKFFVAATMIICALCLALGLAACGPLGGGGDNDEGASSQTEHTVHAYNRRSIQSQYIKSPATCTEAAVYYYSCVCGEKGETTFTGGSPLGHIGGTATCAEAATCTRCNQKYGNALPHTDRYTSNGDGTHKRDCSVCKTVLKPSEPCTGGTADCLNKAVCETCGSQYGALDPNAHDFKNGVCTRCSAVDQNQHFHSYADGWTYDQTHHWHAATCEHTEEKSAMAPHAFVGEVTTPATETTEGEKTLRCSVCGYSYTQAIPPFSQGDKDFTGKNEYETEAAIDYRLFFLPEQGYVGDVMPYYENGVYYLFYLKDEGGSFNHSVYLAETTNFLSYTDKGEILRSSYDGWAQDNWIGTGSVVKVEGVYYLFYTGHNKSLPVHEKVMVARSRSDLYHFEKIDGFFIEPDSSLSANDFRDPQAYYDGATRRIELTITTRNDVARVVKYSCNSDLSGVTYDGVVYSDERFMNMECSDTFRLGDKWYLTFSGQDDTLYYCVSDSRYSGYGRAERCDGPMFYAPKHVDNGEDFYMVGWNRRRKDFHDLAEFAWAGTMEALQLHAADGGALYLSTLSNLGGYFINKRSVSSGVSTDGNGQIVEYSKIYESYMITGQFTFTGNAQFGLAFGIGNDVELRHISVLPAYNMLEYRMNNLNVNVGYYEYKSRTPVAGQPYSFTYVQEGSVGILSIDGIGAISVRMYGAQRMRMGFFSYGGTVEWTNLELYTR